MWDCVSVLYLPKVYRVFCSIVSMSGVMNFSCYQTAGWGCSWYRSSGQPSWPTHFRIPLLRSSKTPFGIAFVLWPVHPRLLLKKVVIFFRHFLFHASKFTLFLFYLHTRAPPRPHFVPCLQPLGIWCEDRRWCPLRAHCPPRPPRSHPHILKQMDNYLFIRVYHLL